MIKRGVGVRGAMIVIVMYIELGAQDNVATDGAFVAQNGGELCVVIGSSSDRVDRG